MDTGRIDVANKVVAIKADARNGQLSRFGGSQLIVEDWWDTLTGKSWKDTQGNPACLLYLVRTAYSPHIKIPMDDEVVYGKINGLGYLVHISEIEEDTL